MQSKYAEENLHFILKVDKYKNMDNLVRRQRIIWDLYHVYIAIGAKHELNLDSMLRKVTTLAMITESKLSFCLAHTQCRGPKLSSASKPGCPSSVLVNFEDEIEVLFCVFTLQEGSKKSCSIWKNKNKNLNWFDLTKKNLF